MNKRHRPVGVKPPGQNPSTETSVDDHHKKLWRRPHVILLAASFLYLAITNLVWIQRDTRPPFWDMAMHGSAAIRIYDGVAVSGLYGFANIPKSLLSTGYAYPPLYQTIVAGAWALFGQTVNVARMANLPALGILLLATYGIGRYMMNASSAALAASLVCFYPYLLWISRETTMDYWLTAMVALGMWALLRTNDFSDRRWSIVFGIVCGFGMLTKWTFPLFVALPALWLARRQWKHAVLAVCIAVAISACWYIPAASILPQFLNQNIAGGVSEGDPARTSWQALVFYVRALESYQLFLPLFAVFIASLVLRWKRFNSSWTPILLWIVGGWVGLMLFQNKDPRYSAPLLPAIALISAPVFRLRAGLTVALAVLLLVQHYAVSFGLRNVPESVVLMEGLQGPLSWNWNLYSQTYFGLWGPPAREDWQIQRVLEKVSRDHPGPVRLGLVPDIPRFDALAFEFYVALTKAPITVNRLWTPDASAVLANDYVLISEKGQGFYSFDAGRKPIGDFVIDHPERFRAVESFTLPNSEVIRMYKVTAP